MSMNQFDKRGGADDKVLRGDSDNTRIGNIGDTLKVSAFMRPDPLSATYDSFGKLQVVVPQVVYDVRFTNSLQPLVTTTNTANSGTVTLASEVSSAALNVTAANGSKALLQSREYIHFQPGRTSLFYLAGKFSDSSVNRKQRLGCFDNINGLFFEYENSVLYVVTRTGVFGPPVDTRIAQSSWNIDKMDGTGVSGITLNPELIQTYVIQTQGHGSGSRLWGFNIGNEVFFVHKEDSANVSGIPWAATGDFPCRGEIINTAGGGTSTSLFIQSFAALTGGESSTAAITHAVNRNSDASINNGTFSPIISLRLKAATNRGILRVIQIPVLSTSTDNLEVRVVLNPSLTGASWTSAGANSIAEFDTSATSQTGGDVIDFFYVLENGTSPVLELSSLVKLVSNYNGTADILTVAIRSADNSASARAAIVYKELF